MIRLLGNIPNDCYVAVSGGVDSMVCLDFLLNGRYTPTVAYFDHGTEHGADAKEFVNEVCESNKIPLVVSQISREREKGESKEEYWRNERLNFFHGLDKPVITAHHLDDVLEWWIFSSLHGESKLIPYSNKNIIRPFLLTAKKDIIEWSIKKGVGHIVDPSNANESYMRNLIRHKIVPHAMRVNPGLRSVLRKKLEFQFNPTGSAHSRKNWYTA